MHGEAQERVAEASKRRVAEAKTSRWFNRTIQTELLPAERFYLAEDYHQKYYLQNSPRLWGDILASYRDDTMGWINSTAAARLNGYIAGYASAGQLEEEIDRLGLSEPARTFLRQVVDQRRARALSR